MQTGVAKAKGGLSSQGPSPLKKPDLEPRVLLSGGGGGHEGLQEKVLVALEGSRAAHLGQLSRPEMAGGQRTEP